MVKLALYKKPGHWTNGVIRWRCSSQYSHTEMVLDSEPGMCYSASGWDGGVRRKEIDITDGGWDVIDLPWVSEAAVLNLYALTSGCGYDWVGTVIGGGLSIKFESSNNWMCSEWCAQAIGFNEPWRFTPASLGAALSPWALPRPV